jgi:hypothetical protein
MKKRIQIESKENTNTEFKIFLIFRDENELSIKSNSTKK